MQTPDIELRAVEVGSLGERFSTLRLCEAAAIEGVRRSLERHGQLTALTLFAPKTGLEIIDGFKRVRAARALGWPTLLACVDDLSPVDAKLRPCALHDRRGHTELEEAWLVRSLGGRATTWTGRWGGDASTPSHRYGDCPSSKCSAPSWSRNHHSVNPLERNPRV